LPAILLRRGIDINFELREKAQIESIETDDLPCPVLPSSRAIDFGKEMKYLGFDQEKSLGGVVHLLVLPSQLSMLLTARFPGLLLSTRGLPAEVVSVVAAG